MQNDNKRALDSMYMVIKAKKEAFENDTIDNFCRVRGIRSQFFDKVQSKFFVMIIESQFILNTSARTCKQISLDSFWGTL